MFKFISDLLEVMMVSFIVVICLAINPVLFMIGFIGYMVFSCNSSEQK